jgi:hypothetical protein
MLDADVVFRGEKGAFDLGAGWHRFRTIGLKSPPSR